MQLKRSILLKQFTAVGLLLVLLFVNIIQLAHTHTGKPATSSQVSYKKQANKEYHTAKADAKCFICEYQLAKDADNYFSTFTIDTAVSFITTSTAVNTSVTTDNIHCFETRGPPSIA